MKVTATCCDNLRELKLSGTNITDTGLEGLRTPHLEKLEVSDCKNITVDCILKLMTHCSSKLTQIVFSCGDKSVGGRLANWIENHTPGKLKLLSWPGCGTLGGADRKRIRSCLPNTLIPTITVEEDCDSLSMSTK